MGKAFSSFKPWMGHYDLVAARSVFEAEMENGYRLWLGFPGSTSSEINLPTGYDADKDQNGVILSNLSNLSKNFSTPLNLDKLRFTK